MEKIKPLIIVKADLCTQKEMDEVSQTLKNYLGQDYYVIVSNLDIEVYGIEKENKVLLDNLEFMDELVKENYGENSLNK